MARAVLIWTALALAILVPLGLAASSPLLAWRDPTYIVAGFAGIVALALLLVQPLLAAGLLTSLTSHTMRGLHRATGACLVLAVIVHVAGLWITSPPDVIDALTLTSPTPFSLWGVIAMWAVFATAVLVALKRRLHPKHWRILHRILAAFIVVTTTLHALLILGTMEPVSKAILCGLVILATGAALRVRRPWR